MTGVFVTGTDTGVGKTEVSLALLYALQARGLAALGMKPVASDGQAGMLGVRCDDALRLQAQGSLHIPYEVLNPYAFVPAIAPHIAAGEAGIEIELARIGAAYEQLAAQADWVVVEGVGGWRVPLGPSLFASDLPTALGLPVILVIGLRLGCINHSLLTVESIRAQKVPLVGWVGNLVDPGMRVRDQNIATLAALIDAPNLGIVPWMEAPTAEAVAEYLTLDSVLGET